MIYCIGECLIDFIAQDCKSNLGEVNSFLKRAGGAPANVAVAASKLGASSAFIGQIGKDSFGYFLKRELEYYGVNTQYTFLTDKAKTALAFVSLDDKAERDFCFYRQQSADLLLSIKQVEKLQFKVNDFLIFGSVGLVPSALKETTTYLLQKAKKMGAKVIFDPNLRFNLWSSKEECLQTVRAYLGYADYLKLTEDEAELISDKKNDKEYFLSKGIEAIFLTLGEKGAKYISRKQEIYVPSKKVNCVDTTGAGDSFVGSLAMQLQNKKLAKWDKKELLSFCNQCAGLTVTVKGSMQASPYLKDANYLKGAENEST